MRQLVWDEFRTNQLPRSQTLFSSRLTYLWNNRTSSFAETFIILVQVSFSRVFLYTRCVLPMACFPSVLALLLLFHLKLLLLNLGKGSLLPTVP